MTLDDLLVELGQCGVKLRAEDEELRVRAPKDSLTPELRAALSQHKQAILDRLLQRETTRTESSDRPGPIDRSQPLELSFAQQRLWFLSQMDPDSPVYNLPNVGRLAGALDVDRLKAAINALVQRHEVLRTSFQLRDQNPVQIISERVDVALPITDLRAEPEAERVAAAHRLAREEAERPFNLDAPPLLRTSLLQLGDQEYWFMLTLHHSVSDGWSWTVILRDLKAAYEQTTDALPQLPIQFADYAAWERSRVDSQTVSNELEYWKDRLSGELPVLQLPADHPRPTIVNYRGACHDLTISASLTDRLRDLGKQEGATIFMTLLAAFQTLLSRYSGQTDVCVGTPIARRNQAEVEDLIGCFINSLVMRSDLSEDPTFRELLQQVRSSAAAAYGRQDVPFEKLVEELQPERNLSHSPLFQSMLILHVQDKRRVTALGEVSYTPIPVHSRSSKFDLTLELQETDAGLVGWFEYSSELFEPETIVRLEQHFVTLLEALIASPDTAVSRLLLVPEPMQQAQVELLSGQVSEYPNHSALQAIQEQVGRSPDKIAVTCGADSLTYSELNAKANGMARALCDAGVSAELPVAVCLERSTDLLVSLLAVWKSGAAYVPLDPSYPEQRIRYVLDDAGVAALVAEPEWAQALGANCPLVVPGAQEAAETNLDALPSVDSLAYIIYTSGSTGNPKGVEIGHRSLMNFLWSMRERPGFQPSDKLLAVTTVSFDIAGLELYLPLICGGEVVLATSQELADGRRLGAMIDDMAISVMQATPATWQMLFDSGWDGSDSLKVLCGGEALPRPLANRLADGSAEVWNMYGPTETTIWSAASSVRHGEGNVSIGAAIANTQLYVLDPHLQPVPQGVAGELCIGGDGLAEGYRGLEALTNEKFVEDAYSARKGDRLYRTGDLARLDVHGRLEFLGRSDHQVKVRGFRIELGEIESVLNDQKDIDQAIVVAKEFEAGDARLVAFATFKSVTQPRTTQLRKQLRRALPDYMVPSAFMFLEAFPLTPNGKVDRLALLEAAMPDAAPREFQPPHSEMEKYVAQLWQDVVGVERVGLNDNFFEIGGHSLLSMRVLHQIELKTGQFINPREIFTSTLQQFAAVCEKSENKAASA